MFSRELFKTKTFWGGICSLATGIGLIVSGNVPEGVVTIVVGIQSIFVRDALTR